MNEEQDHPLCDAVTPLDDGAFEAIAEHSLALVVRFAEAGNPGAKAHSSKFTTANAML